MKHVNHLSLRTDFHPQNGAVLAISLIMLLLLAMIGTFGLQNSMLQERMSGNMRDKDLAFQAAETTVKQVQRLLSNGTLTNFNDSGTDGLYTVTTTEDLSEKNLANNDAFWEDANKTAEDTDSALGNGLGKNPQYIVQKINPITSGTNSEPACRIVVRSTGKNPNSVVVLQVVFTTSSCA